MNDLQITKRILYTRNSLLSNPGFTLHTIHTDLPF
jgi:hypothetical protein